MRIRPFQRTLLALALCGPLALYARAQEGSTAVRTGPLIKDLRSEDVQARRGAATILRTANRPVLREALPTMIELLMKEKDGQVRLAILDAVAALGRDAEPAVPALLQTLRTDIGGRGSEATHQDYRSALALAAVGKPAVEGLRGLLREKKESVRAETIMALGRIGPDSAPAIPDLRPLLGDRSERIRHEAILALGRIGPAAFGPLIAASADKDARIRAGAIEGLGNASKPDDRVRRAVLTCAHDPVPRVQAAALRSAARLSLPDDALLPTLGEALRHKDEPVRLAAVHLLAGRRASLAALAKDLQSLLTADDDGVSRHAAFLLGKLGPDAVPRLIAALEDPKSRIDRIAEALAQVGKPAIPAIVTALDSQAPRVRRGAALALGQIRPLAPDAPKKLGAGLKDPDRDVKGACLDAIGYLGPRAREVVPAVRVMLRDGSAEIRLKAVNILARSAPHDEHLIGDLTALLDDADRRVQRQAMDILRSLGPPGRPALEQVVGKLASPHPEVRIAAAEFIGSHGTAGAAAVPQLGRLLDDATPGVRTAAARALARQGKAAQPAFAKIASLLKAEQVEVREAGVVALGSLELDAEALRPHLAGALRDDKAEIRRAAMRAIQRLGPQGAVFVPDIILLAGKRENLVAVQRMLRRFERLGPDARSLPELVKQLDHDQDSVRLLAIKFLAMAGPGARDALPALERMREDRSRSPEVRKQAAAASERLKSLPSSAPREARPSGDRPTAG